MDEGRSSPEEILRLIQKEEIEKNKGRLKIFFGYAAGVGKTYAMLQAAHIIKQRGIDVIAGYIEPHARKETAALQDGLDAIATKEVKHGNIILHEFDLDAAIARKPQIILVDELAHTNAIGSRHKKRYQDIHELLNHGIDVYTTVNVQHIESLNDLVASITGITVNERIPDSVFDDADQVELVDIEPKDLIERLMEGKVYQQKQVEQAMGNFFTVQNLVALREIALRRCADRINRMLEQKDGKANSLLTDEHILVCLSSSLTNAKIIRTAARMASAFKGVFTALFVETSDFSTMNEKDKNQLRQNIRLAQQLGATIEAAYGDDIAFQIAEFARLSGVTKVVLGRSNTHRSMFGSRSSLTEKITQLSPNLDIYIIPDQHTNANVKDKVNPKFEVTAIDLMKSTVVLLISTLIGYLFFQLNFSESNIVMVYILGVLVIAIITSKRMYSLICSIISVLAFNFFFTDPRFSLDAYDTGYPATFLIMFIVAFLSSSLAVRIQKQARQSAATAYRTKILFDTNRQLGNEKDISGIIAVTCNQLTKLLERDILFYLAQADGLEEPLMFPSQSDNTMSAYLSDNERAVATWVYHNNKHAGATTNTLGDSKCLYLSVRVGLDVYGVVGIAISEVPLDAFENSIMLSILGECALAMKNDKVSKEREEASLLAKNEQLRANLLRSISHDLRTPLTSISGNAGILLSNEKNIDIDKRKQLYTNIYDDSLWLINLVENLLSVTRIEDGTMKLHPTTELLEEVITEALQHTDRKRTEHNIIVKPNDAMILVKVDTRLIMQVFINLVDNAIKYTPIGSNITIETIQKDHMVEVSVSDNGKGIVDEAKEHIFDMFYTAETKIVDSRRSLGLGLALCKSIIIAHGGNISVSDENPHGARFTFTLPSEEVTLYE